MCSADDPVILRHAVEFQPADYFSRAEVWQQLDSTSFYPMLTLSFDVDHALAGQEPRAFYLHHLCVSIAIGLAIFALLSLWVCKSLAFFAALLAVSGTPLRVTGQELMSRHYLEGVMLAALCVLVYVSYLRAGGRWRLVLAVALYGAAVLAKEIFYPLPALLFLLPEGDRSQRLRSIGPFAILAAVLLLWIWSMLGALVGGPTHAPDWRAVLMLPVRIGAYAFGGSWLGFVAAGNLALTVAIVAWADRRWIAWLSLGAILALAPLAPVAARLGPRHQVLAWVVACCVVVLAGESARRLFGRRWVRAWSVGLVVFCAVFIRGEREQTRFVKAREEYSVTGQFSLAAGPHKAILATDSLNAVGWFFDNLHWLEGVAAGRVVERPRIVSDKSSKRIRWSRASGSTMPDAPAWSTARKRSTECSPLGGPASARRPCRCFSGSMASN